MSIRWLLAALHLFGLAIGLGAVWARSRALRAPLDDAGVRRVLYADNWWGISAGILVVTGLIRAFAGFEKGAQYYLNNHLFLGKLGILLVIIALEIGPMIGFIGWRKQLRSHATPDVSRAERYAGISTVQAVLVLLMIIAATGMARGYGTE